MNIIKKETKLCLACMEVHEVLTIREKEWSEFQGERVEYENIYEYCERTDDLLQTEAMFSDGILAIKNAYRRKVGLLTGDEIVAIRKKYGISQSDLGMLLDWGEKTIARYETFQVQERSYDMILRRIDEDPEWFLECLERKKERLKEKKYRKYRERVGEILRKNPEVYHQKVIAVHYAGLNGQPEVCGGVPLNLRKVVEMIDFFAASKDVDQLHKVKLMKLLRYADALSFKRRDVSMSGLAYEAMPMGAVPKCHEDILRLTGVRYEETEVGDATRYDFYADPEMEYQELTDEDIQILNQVIDIFGRCSRAEIVERMHQEDAFQKTKPFALIHYSLTKTLSID